MLIVQPLGVFERKTLVRSSTSTSTGWFDKKTQRSENSESCISLVARITDGDKPLKLGSNADKTTVRFSLDSNNHDILMLCGKKSTE